MKGPFRINISKYNSFLCGLIIVSMPVLWRTISVRILFSARLSELCWHQTVLTFSGLGFLICYSGTKGCLVSGTLTGTLWVDFGASKLPACRNELVCSGRSKETGYFEVGMQSCPTSSFL